MDTPAERQYFSASYPMMGSTNGAERVMYNTIIWTACYVFSTLAFWSPLAAEPSSIGEEEAHSIGIEAYLYFYPLLTMELTRLQATNVEPGKQELRGPMNTFSHAASFPTADFKLVVRPNFDTLYSSAWLDVSKEPVIVSVPDTGGRYYLLPMLDMWTDVFASPGWRTTGTAAGNFLIKPRGWKPGPGQTIPEGVEQIFAPTPYVWIIGRTKTDGPSDYDAVHKIQAGFKVTPLSQWGEQILPAKLTIDPSIDMETPPKTQVDNMPAGKYFGFAAELLKLQPPHLTDQPILARMKRIGIEPGKSFDLDKMDPAIKAGLETVPADAQKLMAWKIPTMARVTNGWSMNTDTMGVYGNYYLKRAMVAQVGLGANLPEDAIYPLNLTDGSGKPLEGANKYRIHFDKETIPPAEAFWSITLYDPEGFQVPNPLNRFAISSWMPLRYNPDGSLDLYFQNDSPGADNEANWLPAPRDPFNLTMRIYAPRSEALTGKWNPPPVIRE
jgi:hypothetical protein